MIVLTVSSVGSGEDTQLGLFSNCFSFFGSYADGDLGSNDDYGSWLFGEVESEVTINVWPFDSRNFLKPNSPETHPNNSPGLKSIPLGVGRVIPSGYLSSLGKLKILTSV